MFKKILLALGLISLASLSVAATPTKNTALTAAQKSAYYTSESKSTNNVQVNAKFHPPTDITIANGSSSYIYFEVPGTGINRILYSGNNGHIYNNQGPFYTPIILRDPNNNVFFNSTVCPLAILSVYGIPGSYRVNVDSDLCL